MTEPSSARPVPGPPRPGPAPAGVRPTAGSPADGGPEARADEGSRPDGSPSSSGDERGEAASYEELEQRPVAEHVAVFEAEHARLQRELGTIDQL